MKVIIVDDEPLMCKGIHSKIDWTANQLEFAGEAKDGIEALELIRKTRPDIVITDIRMPVMDGLELIEQAKLIDPTLRFIVVSGHDEFHYARKALCFGVSNYLLKPVHQGELNETLDVLRNKWVEQMQELGFRTKLLQTFQAYHNIQRRHKLSRLLLPGATDEAAAEFFEHWDGPPAAQYSAVVFRLQTISFPHAGFQFDEEDLLWYGIQNIVEQSMLEKGQQGIVYKHAFRAGELVTIIPQPVKEPVFAAYRWAESALQAIHRYLKLDAVAGAGEPVDSPRRLSKSYEQAARAARNEVLHGTGKIYYSGTEKPLLPIITGEQERLLFIHLREGNEQNILAWLEGQYERLANHPHSSYKYFEHLSVQIYAQLDKLLREMSGEQEVLTSGHDEFVTGLTAFRTWREAANSLLRIAMSVLNVIKKPERSTGGDIVDQVKHDLERYYNENITLSWVAHKYYIHPNYFSKLFKERCGINFSEYITKIRLDKAVQLLKNRDRSIAEISELVGYESAAYFSSVFRKAYGVSPKMYQDMLSR